MVRNDFLVLWLVAVTLVIFLVLGGTVFFVWQSGLLSGEVPLVESTSGVEWEIEEEGTEPGEVQEAPTGITFEAPVACLDPESGLLVRENRAIREAPTRSLRMLHILGSLHDSPNDPKLTAAVPPEIQFRSVFVELERNLVFVDLAGIPEGWGDDDPLVVGQTLFSIAHTICFQNPSYQAVQFLIDGRESNLAPGGFLLSKPFAPLEDWIRGHSL